MPEDDEQMRRVIGSLGNALTRHAKTQRAGFGTEDGEGIAYEGLRVTLEAMAEGNMEAIKNTPPAFRDATFERVASALEGQYNGMDEVAANIRAGKLVKAAQGLEQVFREGYVPVERLQSEANFARPDFFARDANTVAKELCGSRVEYVSSEGIPSSLVVSHTASYKEVTDKDREVAQGEPGTVGVWQARQPILIISAHTPENRKGSTVAVWEMKYFGDKDLGMGKVGKALEITEHAGEVIGRDSPIGLYVRDVNTDKVGNLRITPMGKAKGASASYKLK